MREASHERKSHPENRGGVGERSEVVHEAEAEGMSLRGTKQSEARSNHAVASEAKQSPLLPNVAEVTKTSGIRLRSGLLST